MKTVIPLLLLCFFSLTSCFEDEDDTPIETSEISDFVWRGMNRFYLYKSEIPDLADDRFTSLNSSDYFNYLNTFETPDQLFNSLIFDRQNVDKFSWIVDDFFALEQNFSGTSRTTGMELYRAFAPNSDAVIGIVRLVLPGSDADLKGLKRGAIFYAIDGTPLTETNFGALLEPERFTLNIATYNDNGTPNDSSDDSITPTETTITLDKTEFTEAPIFSAEVFEVQGQNIGYLMYNGFIRGSENELNTAFANFRANNVQQLVLDLRYNPGGSVAAMAALASMITGQFTGDLVQRLVFNETSQGNNRDFNFIDTLPDGSGAINSLGLNSLHVLATGLSASASEGLINSLNAYIPVTHIGSNTVGKTQASRTLYDSPDFSRNNPNPSHTYAMQPIIANGINNDNQSVPATGLVPTLPFFENVFNLGTIGTLDEPMLARAIANITGATLKTSQKKSKVVHETLPLIDNSDFRPHEGGMFID